MYKRDMTRPLPARTSPLVRSRTSHYPLDLIEEGSVILLALASLRFATGTHIQRVVFNRMSSTPRQARHRSTRSLRRLFDAGYLSRVSVFAPSASSGQVSMQIVTVLSAKGATAIGLEPRWARSRAPKEREVLSHAFCLVELAVCAMEGWPEPLSITTWWDDRVLAGRRRRGQLSLPNIPDGLLVVENLSTGKLFPSFIEVDMGTESVSAHSHARRDFARKIEGYLEYLGRAFRSDFGIQAPPIVLIVTDSERRMESLRTTTQRLGGGGRFWFSTLARLRKSGVMDGQQTIDSAARQGPY